MIAGQKHGFWSCSRVGREFREHLKVVRKRSRNAPQAGGRCRVMVRGNVGMRNKKVRPLVVCVRLECRWPAGWRGQIAMSAKIKTGSRDVA